MSKIQKIFQQTERQYTAAYGKAMPAAHRKALRAIQCCRAEHMGVNLYQCPDCGHVEMAMRSCANRHCPTCQGDKGREWFQKNSRRLLPGAYFMVTFTIPQQLRSIARSNQRLFYDAMFTCAWKSMHKLGADPKYLGAKKVGAMGILHTWTRQMHYHPHIHFLVPAGGLDKDGNWIAGRQDFLFPIRALSRLFRAQLLEVLKANNIAYPPVVWRKEWNVNCEHKGNGQGALRYLSNYLFRVAISNSRIVKTDAESVTFRYKKRSSDKYRNEKVTPVEFVRRYLQHVLPQGFVKVRHYGFMAAAACSKIAQIAEQVFDGFASKPQIEMTQLLPKGYRCTCGARMLLSAILSPLALLKGSQEAVQTEAKW